MITVKRILVPTDHGPTSDAALRYGVELARLFGARLHVLHVVDVSAGVREFAGPSFPAPAIGAGDGPHGLPALAYQLELHPVCETRVGAPADEILECAFDRDIDLIVMGTHGRHGVARALLGSIAETIVRRASCPVLTIRAHGGEPLPQEADEASVAVMPPRSFDRASTPLLLRQSPA